jgi:hypothetical protein
LSAGCARSMRGAERGETREHDAVDAHGQGPPKAVYAP